MFHRIFAAVDSVIQSLHHFSDALVGLSTTIGEANRQMRDKIGEPVPVPENLPARGRLTKKPANGES